MPCYALHILFIWQVVAVTLNRKLGVHYPLHEQSLEIVQYISYLMIYDRLHSGLPMWRTFRQDRPRVDDLGTRLSICYCLKRKENYVYAIKWCFWLSIFWSHMKKVIVWYKVGRFIAPHVLIYRWGRHLLTTGAKYKNNFLIEREALATL
jgi:hypothetical protein